MNPRLKSILLVLGFLTVVIAIAAALYVVFFRQVSQTPGVEVVEAPSGVTVPGTGLPPAGEGAPVSKPTPSEGGGIPEAPTIAGGGVTKTEALTTGPALHVALSSDGASMNYYDRKDGHFYTINDQGEVVRLSDQTFPKVDSVSWNQDASKAVLEFPDGSNIVYDFENETQVSLPAHWQDFEFSPNADQIISKSIGIDPKSNAIIITNADGSGAKAVAALGNNADKVDLNWSPNDQVIGFSDTAGSAVSGLARKLILPIGKNQENFRGLTVEGLDFIGDWSPRGDKLVYSSVGSTNDYRPMLWVVDGSGNDLGNNRRMLGIETWADKCTFSDNSTMYCAVPDRLDANVGLQRVLADNVSDSIYRININTGTTTRVAIPETPQSIETLRVSEDGSRVFFTNKSSGILQSIRLK